jgi:hypothetical protein
MTNGPAQPSEPAKTIANTLVREPLMITLPLAFALAGVIWKLPGGGWSKSNFAALLAAFVISLLVWAADVFSLPADQQNRSTYLSRLIYVAFNTLLVAGILTGLISKELVGL